MTQSKNGKADRPHAVTDSDAAQLLVLFARQVEAAFIEASADIDQLSRAVLDAARNGSALQAGIVDSTPRADADADRLGADADAMQKALQNANASLQFADQLRQRLPNVSKNLNGLAALMKLTDRPIANTQWRECLEVMRATYTMEQEREMFDAAFNLPVSEDCAAQDSVSSQQPVLFDTEVGNESE